MSFPGSLGVLVYPCVSGCACSVYTQLVLNLIDFLNSFTCWWTASIWCLNFSQLLSKKYSVFCPAHFSIGIRFKYWFYSNSICPVLIFFFFATQMITLTDLHSPCVYASMQVSLYGLVGGLTSWNVTFGSWGVSFCWYTWVLQAKCLEIVVWQMEINFLLWFFFNWLKKPSIIGFSSLFHALKNILDPGM